MAGRAGQAGVARAEVEAVGGMERGVCGLMRVRAGQVQGVLELVQPGDGEIGVGADEPHGASQPHQA